ncbi:MAG: nucleoside hydrolase [Actinomycetota bacterium]
MTDRPKLILDCDPGLDDAAALVVAAHYAELVGVTTVGGNAPLADVTTNALLTTQVFDIDVEVHVGAVRPLVAEPRHAPHIHGENGFEGPSLPPVERSVASDDAIGFIIETVRATEGIWLVPTGPLTNIAIAIRSAPDILDRIAGISFMGGSATFGNHTPTAEFNIMVDPEAAAAVMAAPTTIHMAGLDLTHQFVVDDALPGALRAVGNPGAEMLADLTAAYLDGLQNVRGRRRGGLHDPCAVMALTHPELIEATLRPVAVELSGGLTRGMTVVDQRDGASDGLVATEPGAVWHGHTLDGAGALAVLLEAVAARG